MPPKPARANRAPMSADKRSQPPAARHQPARSQTPEEGVPDTRTPVPVSERDYLEQDPELRGQRFACVSFVSPEDVLMRKDAFVFLRFLDAVRRDLDDMMSRIEGRYADEADGFVKSMVAGVRERHAYLRHADEMKRELDAFAATNAAAIDRDFARTEGGAAATSVRGFKIRGAFATLEEAKARAAKIRSFDDKFNVFVAEVGCWCPWSPNPDEIPDCEYAETQLNTLMKSYMSNGAARDEFYMRRKERFLVDASRDNQEKRRAHDSDAVGFSVELLPATEDPIATPAEAGEAGPPPFVATSTPHADALQEDDPWMSARRGVDAQPAPLEEPKAQSSAASRA